MRNLLIALLLCGTTWGQVPTCSTSGVFVVTLSHARTLKLGSPLFDPGCSPKLLGAAIEEKLNASQSKLVVVPAIGNDIFEQSFIGASTKAEWRQVCKSVKGDMNAKNECVLYHCSSGSDVLLHSDDGQSHYCLKIPKAH